MYSNYPSTKIKEEVDINRAGDPAIIKLEQYSNYEESSESFKIEKVKIDNWVGCGSSTMECVNGEIAKEVSLTIPIKDELAVKLENNLDDASFDTLDRIKPEPVPENWDELKLLAEQVKDEEQGTAGVKQDKMKLGTEMGYTKPEDIAAAELTEDLDIKSDGIPDAEGDSPSNPMCWETGVEVEADKDLFVCHNCNYTANCKENIVGHLILGTCSKSESKSRRSKGHMCTQCSKTFRRKMNLDDHVLKKHSELIATIRRKIHVCPDCTYKTTIKSFLADHMLTHVSMAESCKLDCVSCDAKFKRRLALDEHVLRKHPEWISSVSSKMYVCPNCPYVTVRKDVLDKHMFQHPESPVTGSNPNKCKHCDAAFKSKVSVDDHVIKNHPDFISLVTSKVHECPKCPYKTTIKHCIEAHIMTEHPDTASDLFMTCEHCKAAFKNRRTLDDHIIRKHPNHITSIKSNVHQCPYCTYKTVRKCDLDKHLSTHPNVPSKYELSRCAYCDVGFKSRQVLDDHVIREHPSYITSVTSKIHKCSKCEYITTLKNNVDRHTMSVHPDEASDLFSKCVHCNTSFKNRLALDDHIVRKHPDVIASISRKIYQCPTCMYKTVRKSDLMRHILVHREANSVGE